MRKIVLLIALIGLIDCKGFIKEETPQKETIERNEVQKACDRLRELDCEEGKKTPKGHTCEEYMETVKDVFDLKCLSEVIACDLVVKC